MGDQYLRPEHHQQPGHTLILLCGNPDCSNPVQKGSVSSCSELCALTIARRRLRLRHPVPAVLGRGQWLFEERQRLGVSRAQLASWLTLHWRSLLDVEVRNEELPRTWATTLHQHGFSCDPWLPAESPATKGPAPAPEPAAHGDKGSASAPARLPSLDLEVRIALDSACLGDVRLRIPGEHVLAGIARLARWIQPFERPVEDGRVSYETGGSRPARPSGR